MVDRRKPEQTDPQSIANSLERLLGGLNAPTVDMLSSVFGEWETIVGPDLAERSSPGSVDGDELTISVTDPAWATEFRWLEKELIERLAQVTGSDRIQRLRIRVV
jgi:predicted nucleic acid-binding Zn ribbon protein